MVAPLTLSSAILLRSLRRLLLWWPRHPALSILGASKHLGASRGMVYIRVRILRRHRGKAAIRFGKPVPIREERARHSLGVHVWRFLLLLLLLLFLLLLLQGVMILRALRWDERPCSGTNMRK